MKRELLEKEKKEFEDQRGKLEGIAGKLEA